MEERSCHRKERGHMIWKIGHVIAHDMEERSCHREEIGHVVGKREITSSEGGDTF